MVDALFQSILEAVPEGGTPRERIETQMLTSRRAFVAHPQIAAAMAVSEGDTPAAVRLMESAISSLSEMGLSGDNLVRGYQTLESYSVGSSIFDMARAPDNMTIRRARYRLLEHPAFDAVAKSETSVSETTEKAYELGMLALIDYVATLAD